MYEPKPRDFCASLDYYIEDEGKANKEYLAFADELSKRGLTKEAGIVKREVATQEAWHKQVMQAIKAKECGRK